MTKAMNNATKTSITLPPHEQQEVVRLRQELRLASNVEVVRRALHLLAAETRREALRREYAAASRAVRTANAVDVAELDALAGEGLE